MIKRNEEYKTYESRYVNVGKIGHKACKKKAEALKAKNNLVAAICNSYVSEIEDPRLKLWLRNVLGPSFGGTLEEQIIQCEEDHGNPYSNNTINYKQGYCTLQTQWESSSVDIEENPSRKTYEPNKKHTDFKPNALINRYSIICDNHTAYISGYDRSSFHRNPDRCFHLEKGSKIDVIKMYEIKSAEVVMFKVLVKKKGRGDSYTKESYYARRSAITMNKSKSVF